MKHPTPVLRDLLPVALTHISQLTEVQLLNKPDPNRWSKIELLGHLVDSALINHGRFAAFLLGAPAVFTGYDQEAYVRINRYADRRPAEVIATWRTANEHLAHLLDSFPAERLEAVVGEHNFHRISMRAVVPGAALPFGFIVEDYLLHLVHHLRQIVPGVDLNWYLGYQEGGSTFRSDRNG